MFKENQSGWGADKHPDLQNLETQIHNIQLFRPDPSKSKENHILWVQTTPWLIKTSEQTKEDCAVWLIWALTAMQPMRESVKQGGDRGKEIPN